MELDDPLWPHMAPVVAAFGQKREALLQASNLDEWESQSGYPCGHFSAPRPNVCQVCRSTDRVISTVISRGCARVVPMR